MCAMPYVFIRSSRLRCFLPAVRTAVRSSPWTSCRERTTSRRTTQLRSSLSARRLRRLLRRRLQRHRRRRHVRRRRRVRSRLRGRPRSQARFRRRLTSTARSSWTGGRLRRSRKGLYRRGGARRSTCTSKESRRSLRRRRSPRCRGGLIRRQCRHRRSSRHRRRRSSRHLRQLRSPRHQLLLRLRQRSHQDMARRGGATSAWRSSLNCGESKQPRRKWISRGRREVRRLRAARSSHSSGVVRSCDLLALTATVAARARTSDPRTTSGSRFTMRAKATRRQTKSSCP